MQCLKGKVALTDDTNLNSRVKCNNEKFYRDTAFTCSLSQTIRNKIPQTQNTMSP